VCVCSCLCERRPKRCREKLCMFGHSWSSAHETCSSDLIPHQNVTSKWDMDVHLATCVKNAI
jgi:hypothetical protein